MLFFDKKLFTWQEECLQAWLDNGCSGIANVVTGAGKTVLALGAASILSLRESKLRVKIVVPKTFLVSQWTNALKSELSVPLGQIGSWYGRHKDTNNRKYMIYVVNSARYALSRHIIADIEAGYSVLLIADECHHYASEENSRIFEFLPIISNFKPAARFFSLGLSATPQAVNYYEKLVPALGREIYRYNFSDATKAGIVSTFSIFNVSLHFTDMEKPEYDQVSENLSICLLNLKKLCPYLNKLTSDTFFSRVSNLIEKSANPKISDLASAVLNLAYRRRELVYLASARVDCCYELIRRLSEKSRIIIFGERIESAEALYKQLVLAYPGQVGRYHSKMGEQLRRTTLEHYETAQIRILVSCRALDEGLNVPETDIGIVLSSTSSVRQRIQRIGRIIRRSDKSSAAALYYLYVANSNEESTLLTEASLDFENDTKICNIQYNAEDNSFIHPEYDELAKKSLAYVSERYNQPEILSEFRKNLRLGAVRSDWWLSKECCIAKLKAATSKEQRNYYITMLQLIKAACINGS